MNKPLKRFLEKTKRRITYTSLLFVFLFIFLMYFLPNKTLVKNTKANKIFITSLKRFQLLKNEDKPYSNFGFLLECFGETYFLKTDNFGYFRLPVTLNKKLLPFCPRIYLALPSGPIINLFFKVSNKKIFIDPKIKIFKGKVLSEKKHLFRLIFMSKDYMGRTFPICSTKTYHNGEWEAKIPVEYIINKIWAIVLDSEGKYLGSWEIKNINNNIKISKVHVSLNLTHNFPPYKNIIIFDPLYKKSYEYLGKEKEFYLNPGFKVILAINKDNEILSSQTIYANINKKDIPVYLSFKEKNLKISINLQSNFKDYKVWLKPSILKIDKNLIFIPKSIQNKLIQLKDNPQRNLEFKVNSIYTASLFIYQQTKNKTYKYGIECNSNNRFIINIGNTAHVILKNITSKNKTIKGHLFWWAINQSQGYKLTGKVNYLPFDLGDIPKGKWILLSYGSMGISSLVEFVIKKEKQIYLKMDLKPPEPVIIEIPQGKWEFVWKSKGGIILSKNTLKTSGVVFVPKAAKILIIKRNNLFYSIRNFNGSLPKKLTFK